jgi:hypothetical protein
VDVRVRLLPLSLGLGLAVVVIISTIDVARRLDSASVLADSIAILSERAYKGAVGNGLYVLGFLGGTATTIVAVLSVALLRHAIASRPQIRGNRRFGAECQAHDLAATTRSNDSPCSSD